MRNKVLKLYWEIFGYPDLPPKLKDFNPIKINRYLGNAYIPKSNKMYEAYICGISVESIAGAYNVTRERVRQCCWKAYREAVRRDERSND